MRLATSSPSMKPRPPTRSQNSLRPASSRPLPMTTFRNPSMSPPPSCQPSSVRRIRRPKKGLPRTSSRISSWSSGWQGGAIRRKSTAVERIVRSREYLTHKIGCLGRRDRHEAPRAALRTPAATRRARREGPARGTAMSAGRFGNAGSSAAPMAAWTAAGQKRGRSGRSHSPISCRNMSGDSLRILSRLASSRRARSSGSRICEIQAVSRAISGASSGGTAPRMNAASSRLSSQASSHRRSASAREAAACWLLGGERRQFVFYLP